MTILATFTIGDSSYVPVNTRYRVAEIREDCVVGDTTGFMFYRLLISVCEKVQTTKTYQLSHMVLKEYQGELCFVSTLNTTAIQKQRDESQAKAHLNAKTVFCSINKFATGIW